MIRRLKSRLRISILLKISSVLTLIGLALMVWSLAQPTPMPVILAMSLGQVFGILAFLLFGTAILIDQFRKQREQGAKQREQGAKQREQGARGAHGEATASDGVPSYQEPLHGDGPAPDASSALHREAPP